MKNHMKRIAVPRTWPINRKKNKFITRPNPGAHIFEQGLPLGIIVRDMLKLASTMGEVKKVLANNVVLVDGRRRIDHRYVVGLFDTLVIPKLNLYYRMLLSKKGQLIVIAIESNESNIKVCKIIGKKMVTKGRVQLNLHDGKNVLAKIEAKVGDSLVLSLPKLEIKTVLPLKLGSTVFLSKGKHIGDVGTLKDVKGKEARYTAQGKEVETAKSYLFVIGGKEPVIKINEKD